MALAKQEESPWGRARTAVTGYEAIEQELSNDLVF